MSETNLLYPLNQPQKRIWYSQMLYPDTTTCILVGTVKTQKPFNVDLLVKAIENVIQENDALRIRVTFKDSQPKQYIAGNNNGFIKIREFTSGQQEKDNWIKSINEKPMRIYNTNLAEFYIYTCGEEYGYILKVHHIICDGIGLGKLVNEITDAYNSFITYERPPKKDNESYLRSIEKETKYLESSRFIKDKKYWTDKFVSPPEFTEVRPHNPFITNTVSERVSIDLDKDFIKNLKGFCSKQVFNLYTFFLAAISIYLNKTTQKRDIVTGTNYANRTSKEEKNMIGMFASTVAIRTQVNEDEDAMSLLNQISKEQKSVLRHQKYPYNFLVQDIRKAQQMPELGRIFGVSLIYRPEFFLEMDGENIIAEQNFCGHESNDLLINVIDREDEERLILQIDYRTELFSSSYIANLIERIVMVSRQIIDNPLIKVKEISLVGKKEFEFGQQINRTTKEYPKGKTVVQLFEEQVRSTPNNVALVYQDKEVTYFELNQKANQLARSLRDKGVSNETLVGVIAEHSIDLVVGILAILKAGGAYVPIDPKMPNERRLFILRNAEVKLVITAGPLELPEEFDQINVKDVDLLSYETHNLPRASGTNNLAYVIYTSGSTGNPKGVLVEHKGLTNYLNWAADAYLGKEKATFPLYSSISFDLTITSLFVPLMTGNTVIIFNAASNPSVIHDILLDSRVDIIKMTPAHMQILRSIQGLEQSSIKKIIVGGENLNSNLASDIIKKFNNNAVIFNEYGPTETVVGCTMYKYDGKAAMKDYIPIGKPIANTTVYLFDSNMNPVPIGVPGELYIGGEGVTRGYLNLPDMTAEKYIPHPLETERTLYKTGDIAMFLESGDLECVGRIDDQVKVRGYRVETGDVKASFLKVRGVKDVAILVQSAKEGINELWAYYVGEDSLSPITLRKELSRTLPDYMVPSQIIKATTIPLTINGKIDTKKLKETSVKESVSQRGTQPRTSLEKRIGSIWAEVLDIRDIGVEDNFFHLGGDSLKLIHVYGALNKLGIDIPIKELFAHPTIDLLCTYINKRKIEDEEKHQKELLAKIQKRKETSNHNLIKKQNRNVAPLSYNQEALWLVEQLEGKSTKYNIPASLMMRGELSIEAFQYAINELVRKHDILRTQIVLENNAPKQIISPFQSIDLQVDYKTLYEKDEEAIKEQIEKEATFQFDLEKGPLYKFKVYKIREKKFLVCLTFHHIIFDGWSGDVAIKELEYAYNSFLCGEQDAAYPLDLDIQYADYSIWQREVLNGKKFDQLLGYWTEKLKVTPDRLVLPYDYQPSFSTTDAGHIIFNEIPLSLVESVKSFGLKHNSSLYITMLTAYKVLLYFYSNNQNISVGTPVANRNQQGTQELVGYFSNSLVLNTSFDSHLTFLDCLSLVRNTVFGALEHQDMPFGKLVEMLNPNRTSPSTPFFQSWFVLDVKREFNFGDLSTSLVLWGHSGKSKWDLTLNLIEEDNKMTSVIEYKTDLFSKATIKRLLNDYNLVLKLLIEGSEESLESIHDVWIGHSLAYVEELKSSKKKKKLLKTFK